MASNKVYGAWIEYSNNKNDNSPDLTLHEFEEELKTGGKYLDEIKKFYNEEKESENYKDEFDKDTFSNYIDEL